MDHDVTQIHVDGGDLPPLIPADQETANDIPIARLRSLIKEKQTRSKAEATPLEFHFGDSVEEIRSTRPAEAKDQPKLENKRTHFQFEPANDAYTDTQNNEASNRHSKRHAFYFESKSETDEAESAPTVKFNMHEETPARGVESESLEKVHLEEIENDTTESRLRQLLSESMKIDKNCEMALRYISQMRQDSSSTRKSATRALLANAMTIGAPTLFRLVLILLQDLALSDSERYMFMKLMARLIGTFGIDCRPFTQDVLELARNLLDDPDKFVRAEGRGLVGHLYNSIGLKPLIESILPSLDEQNDTTRASTAIIIAEVCRVCPISKSNMFLQSLCLSKRSWMVNDIGLRAVQNLAKSLGNNILPRLGILVDCTSQCLESDNPRVVTGAAMALASLAAASSPFGIETFEIALNRLWASSRIASGRRLGAIYTALSAIVPLMDDNTASIFTKHLLEAVVSVMRKNDDLLYRAILQVLEACLNCMSVDVEYLRTEISEAFLSSFWLRRLADDSRTFWPIVYVTKQLSSHIGASLVIDFLLMKNVFGDPSPKLRRMSFETVTRIAADKQLHTLSKRSEILLIDALDAAVVKSSTLDSSLIKVITAVFEALSFNANFYIEPFVTVILNKLSSPVEESREMSCLILKNLAPVLSRCSKTEILTMVNSVLFEQLGEDSPRLLVSVLGAMREIISLVPMNDLLPPITDIVPRLTPILRNRSELVQEADILLIKQCADRAADKISAKEWLRITFELLELFRSTRKSVRRYANDTLGSIALGIGPQDVLAVLVNNLKIQDRQSRVSTAVAVAIVAEKCEPFTVLPVLLNEYSSPDITVQISVLKTISFLAEYVGPGMAAYAPSLIPLLEHALTDRNQVKRQTGAAIVKHLALGCAGSNQDELFIHLINLLMPSIFETSPHVITRVREAFTSLRYSVGFGASMSYVWAGLFHPARKVREIYWKLFNDAYIHNSDAMAPYHPVDVPSASIWY